MSDEQPAKPLASDYFRKMADAIDHNAGKSGFGGAAVLVIPGTDISTIELLILDSSQDPAQFLATIATRIQQLTAALNEQARMQMGYGR